MSSHLGVSYDDLSDASIGYIKDRISQYGYLRSYIHKKCPIVSGQNKNKESE